MNRIDNLHLRVGMGYLGQRLADLFKTEPKAFPPVAGNQNHLFTVADERIALQQGLP